MSKRSLRHGFVHQAEEPPVEIRRAPFSVGRVHVEVMEAVPVAFGQVAAGHPFDFDAVVDRFPALPADVLSLLGCQVREELVEGVESGVRPVVLGIYPLQQAELRGALPLRLRHEGVVQGTDADPLGDLDACGEKLLLHASGTFAVGGQQARAGGGGERDAGLKLRIVLSARPIPGFRPAAVEHVFAPGVRLEVHGRDAEKPVAVLEHQVKRLPSRLGRSAAARLQGMQETVVEERVVFIARIRAKVPRCRLKCRRCRCRCPLSVRSMPVPRV